jgi:hypothetical protein
MADTGAPRDKLNTKPEVIILDQAHIGLNHVPISDPRIAACNVRLDIVARILIPLEQGIVVEACFMQAQRKPAGPAEQFNGLNHVATSSRMIFKAIRHNLFPPETWMKIYDTIEQSIAYGRKSLKTF